MTTMADHDEDPRHITCEAMLEGSWLQVPLDCTEADRKARVKRRPSTSTTAISRIRKDHLIHLTQPTLPIQLLLQLRAGHRLDPPLMVGRADAAD